MPKKSPDLKIAKPKRLSKGLSEEGLIEIKIKLRTRTMTVCEASAYQSGIRSSLLAELLDKYDENDGDKAIAYNLLMNFWAPLFACSTGDVPDRDQFLKMAETDMEFWIEAAREVNPTWFAWMDELLKTSDEEIKKKAKGVGNDTPQADGGGS